MAHMLQGSVMVWAVPRVYTYRQTSRPGDMGACGVCAYNVVWHMPAPAGGTTTTAMSLPYNTTHISNLKLGCSSVGMADVDNCGSMYQGW